MAVGYGPLSGVTVVALTQFLSGPVLTGERVDALTVHRSN